MDSNLWRVAPGIRLATSGTLDGKPTQSGEFLLAVPVESSNGGRSHRSFVVAAQR